MSTRGNASRGFTLLEIMIAVAVIALITVSVYSFVVSNLAAIRTTREATEERIALVTLVNIIETELHDLPPKMTNALAGTPHKFNNLPSDELEWTCKPGQGLMTKAAHGDWKTTLAIQPIKKTSRELEIGLRRRLADAKPSDYQWMPLLQNVSALEIRYFDQRLNAWLERWTDANSRPTLVRVRIWRNYEDAPYEAVLTVPSAALQQ